MSNLLQIPFKDEYIEELSDLLGDSYLANNPFLKPLGVTKEQMVQEFRQSYINKTFSNVLVFIDRTEYLNGKFVIIGTCNFGDAMDYLPPINEDGTQKNFQNVPSNYLVRKYMRNHTLQQFFNKYPNIQRGQYAYCSTFALSVKYQGVQGISSSLFSEYLKSLYAAGYKNYCGHAINNLAKGVFRRVPLILKEDIPIDVSYIYVQDLQIYPFKGMNLSQSLFVYNITEETFALSINDLDKCLSFPKPKI